MTCIAGLVHNGVVYIGGDSAGTGGYDLQVVSGSKVFQNKHLIFGFTSSFRFGQILEYEFVPPEKPWRDINPMRYMVTKFVPAMRDCLKLHGYAEIDNSREEGGQCLIGYAGHLFCMWPSYQINEYADGYTAIGAGAQIAHGALFASKRLRNPWRRLEIALEAAERFNAAVRAPFNYISETSDVLMEIAV
jgi:hypothetical protein